MNTRTFGKLKSVINFNAKGKRVILTTFRHWYNGPTPLSATMMVLITLKVLWDQVNFCRCLVLQKDTLSSRDCRLDSFANSSDSYHISVESHVGY